MSCNFRDVLRAMNDTPVEPNGLYWFGVGSNVLHLPHGVSGGVCNLAQAYLIHRPPPNGGHDMKRGPTMDGCIAVYPENAEKARFSRMGDAHWAVISFNPGDSYEQALMLCDRAMKLLLGAA